MVEVWYHKPAAIQGLVRGRTTNQAPTTQSGFVVSQFSTLLMNNDLHFSSSYSSHGFTLSYVSLNLQSCTQCATHQNCFTPVFIKMARCTAAPTVHALTLNPRGHHPRRRHHNNYCTVPPPLPPTEAVLAAEVMAGDCSHSLTVSSA